MATNNNFIVKNGLSIANTTSNTAWDWYPKNPSIADKLILGFSNIPPITTKP